MTHDESTHEDLLRFGFRRFQAAFWISMFAVSVHFLLFVIPGIIHRRWEGEMGGYFVIPAIFIFSAIVVGGGVIWIFGFKILRFVSRIIHFVVARKRVEFFAWDGVFCRSLRPLPWAFGMGAVVYISYFATGGGGWPGDAVVGAIGNLLGALCYGPLFLNWYRVYRDSPPIKTEQAFAPASSVASDAKSESSLRGSEG